MLKYIVVKKIGESIIVFPSSLNHQEIANRFADCEIMSAGFVTIDGKIKCYGESVSLNIRSRETDSLLLEIS